MFYDQDAVWRFDAWHTITRWRIRTFLRRAKIGNTEDALVVNIGSGGESYSFHQSRQLHLDLVLRRLIGRRAIVGDLHRLPLRDGIANLVICVGSVLNHCDSERAIPELSRVLRPGGHIILEFDSSDGLHHLRTGLRHARHACINTFYNRRMVVLREYSLQYVSDALASVGISLQRCESFHIGSAGGLAIGLPPAVAAMLGLVDAGVRLLPSLKMAGSNIIVLGQRQ